MRSHWHSGQDTYSHSSSTNKLWNLGQSYIASKLSILCKMNTEKLPNSLGPRKGSVRVNESYFPLIFCAATLVYFLFFISPIHRYSFAYVFPATHPFPTPEPCTHFPLVEISLRIPALAWMSPLIIMDLWALPPPKSILLIVCHMNLYYPFIQPYITICKSHYWLFFLLDYILSEVHQIPTFI